MAKKMDAKAQVVKKNPTRQKILVEQGRALSSPNIEHKVLYTEIVASVELAKERVKALKEEYKDTDALSICYFSL